MKHKIAVIASALFIALTMTACGSGEPASAPSVADSDKAAVQEKLTKQDSKTDETKADENTVTIQAETETQTDSDGKNILVVYFSRADENYNVGTIDKGNTQIVAEYIASEVSADSFHIETVTPYPADYDDCCDVAKKELADKARPEIKGGVENMESTVSGRQGSIRVDFKRGTNLKMTTVKLQEKISSIRGDFPTDVNVNVQQANVNGISNQFMSLQVRGSGGVDRLRAIVDKDVVPRLESIDGIAGVTVYGGRVKSIEIRSNTEAMEALLLELPPRREPSKPPELCC